MLSVRRFSGPSRVKCPRKSRSRTGLRNARPRRLLDDIQWFSVRTIAVRAIQRLQADEARAAVLRDAGRDATVASVGATAAHAAASVASSELSVALVALTASSLTYAVTEVRRSWVDASVGLRQAAELAEQIADRFDPPPPRDRTSWREKLRRLAATHR